MPAKNTQSLDLLDTSNDVIDEVVTDATIDEPVDLPADLLADDVKGPDTPTANDLKKLRQSLRNKAEREIINRHQDEYHEVAKALFEDEGLVYTKRMTAEEKAAAELRAAIQANPDLAREILSAQA